MPVVDEHLNDNQTEHLDFPYLPGLEKELCSKLDQENSNRETEIGTVYDLVCHHSREIQWTSKPRPYLLEL